MLFQTLDDEVRGNTSVQVIGTRVWSRPGMRYPNCLIYYLAPTVPQYTVDSLNNLLRSLISAGAPAQQSEFKEADEMLIPGWRWYGTQDGEKYVHASLRMFPDSYYAQKGFDARPRDVERIPLSDLNILRKVSFMLRA